MNLSETIAQHVYGKSSSINAKENDNKDFKNGYATGLLATPENQDDEWTKAWQEYGSPLTVTGEWLNWKRGFWSARFNVIQKRAKDE